MKIFLAETSYGSPEITEFEVVENKATYKVISDRAIVGYRIWAKIIKKTDERICFTIPEAIVKLHKKSEMWLASRKHDYERAEAEHKAICDIMEVMHKDPERIERIFADMKKGTL